ncbi:MAG: DUF456 domain-containing protein [Pseudonocardiales bacterium]|nr:DUF456 domain-containing protein [Pseudonocardiales bacterium]
MSATIVIAAVLVVVGLVGVVVPVLPGLLLVAAGIAVWAVPRGDALGWSVLGIAVAIIVAGTVAKYLLPGRKLREAGVPGRTLALGAVLGIVGFFVVPIVGLFLGFVLGVYLGELGRLSDRRQAWASTRRALAAVGASIAIELLTGVLAAGVWVGALVLG